MSEFDEYSMVEVREILPPVQETYHPVKVLQTAGRIRSLLQPADVVHSFIAYPYLSAAAIALTGTAIPITCTALGTYAINPLSSLGTGLLLRYGYRRSATVFCISEYTESRLVDQLSLSNTTVLPLGIDLNEFGTETPREEGYVLSVGAIKPRKGQDVLLRAFAEIADEFPDLQLVVVGGDHSESFREELDSILAETDLNDRVQFFGEVVDREELKELYRGCDLFALTPRVVEDNFEGFGLVFLEAAAYSKPSVATRSGGVPTAVKHGETGLLVEENDVAGVADAMRTLLSEDDLHQEFGTQARARAEALSWERYANTLIERWISLTQSGDG